MESTSPDLGRDPGLFGPDSETWRVHIEPIMWVAGFRAMYLQALHPRVMRGTQQNSALFDPKAAWARFQRTTDFVGVRTFATTEEVERAGERVRRIHASLTGYDPDTGRSFRLDEPNGLLWVHCGEIESYVDVARRSGILDDAAADRYVSESRRAAEVVGLDSHDVPGSRAELHRYFATIRPELYACDEARKSLFTSFNPQVPARLLPLKAAVPAVNLLALACLPRWARRMYGLPALPTTDLAATASLRTLRTATTVLPDTPAPELVREARAAVRAHEQLA